MATYTAATYSFDLSTDTPFRALHGDIDSKIQSLGGWTYVSQTGDGDPSSATAGSNNTYPVWRVYSTTVGSTTWYVRIDFGHNSGPALKVQIGSAVNGSGTLSGQTCTQVTVNPPNTGASQSLHISAVAGRLTIFFALGDNNVSTQGGVALHGNVDGSGSMASGMEIYTAVVNAAKSQYVPASGTVPAQQACWPAAIGLLASNAFGGVTPVFPPRLWDTTGANDPTMAAFAYGASDLTPNTTTTINMYSASRTFIVSKTRDDNGHGTNVQLAFRYE